MAYSDDLDMSEAEVHSSINQPLLYQLTNDILGVDRFARCLPLFVGQFTESLFVGIDRKRVNYIIEQL